MHQEKAELDDTLFSYLEFLRPFNMLECTMKFQKILHRIS